MTWRTGCTAAILLCCTCGLPAVAGTKLLSAVPASSPALTLVKSTAAATPLLLGDQVTTVYVVSNTSDEVAKGVSLGALQDGGVIADETLITDVAPFGDSIDDTANDGLWSTLGRGDSLRFTSVHAASQKDIDALR